MLTRFGVKRLGEGDTAAGANLLAAMACSVATINTSVHFSAYFNFEGKVRHNGLRGYGHLKACSQSL